MERAARGTVGHIGLDGDFRLPEAIGALAFLSATFEADATARGWTELLVREPALVQEGPSGGGVGEMMEELRAITGTPAFSAAIRAATQAAAQRVSVAVAESFGDNPELPFAKVVPAVARASQGLFNDPEGLARSVAGTPEVERLCAEVFSTVPGEAANGTH